jgi:acetolactate synthase-1/2/3 large subunit
MHHASVYFHNSDLVKYAESCGTKGYRIKRAHDLLFTLKSALEDDIKYR